MLSHAPNGLTITPWPDVILVILVDDMGYSDLGCYGGEIRTPNIDRLAANGMKFSAMYNTAKCYPTRACLQTGVYFQRTDRDFSNTATLGEVLRPAGYHTLWSGKHHAKFNPVTRGYDRFYGLIGGAQNHFNPGSGPAPGQPAPASKRDGNRWALDETGGGDVNDFIPQDPKFYDTDAFTDQALIWLNEYQHTQKPFLLYLAYTAPHWPLQAWPEDIARVLRAHSPRTCEARFGQRSAGRISKRVMLITRGNWASRWSSVHPRHSSRVAKYRAALAHAA